jgi:hypothetical protein
MIAPQVGICEKSPLASKGMVTVAIYFLYHSSVTESVAEFLHLLFRVSSSSLKPWVQDWHRLTHSMIFFPQSRVVRRQCQSEKCQSTSILRYNWLSDFLSRESFWPIITNRSAHCWPSETPSIFACKASYKLHQNTTQKNEITGCQKHSLGQDNGSHWQNSN